MEGPEIVYVIDDDESVRRSLSRLLRSEGIAVETFASAEDFLVSGPYYSGVLILDVRMPGMSGLDLQEKLANTSPGLPIVFITAHDDEETRSKAMALGASAFLIKPFEDQILLKVIAEASLRNPPG